MSIIIKNVSKKFNGISVLDNVNLEIQNGQLVALLGPSGSGKTTLLRIIAGLDIPDCGTVSMNVGTKQDTASINVGFVFQHYALFKHMTVYDNVAFGLKILPRDIRPTSNEINAQVMDLLELVHMDNFSDHYPSQLSGGQRQRVALARSLAIRPRILLLDEPFGALDLKLRTELRRWIRKMHKKTNLTIILVTHDQEEALEVADVIVIMNKGNIEQIGKPHVVYNEPINSFVYDFLGNFNIFDGWKNKNGDIRIIEYNKEDKMLTQPKSKKWYKRGKLIQNVLKLITKKKEEREKNFQDGSFVKIFVRPHDMEITKKEEKNKEYIYVTITHINSAGSIVKLELEMQNKSIIEAEISQDILNNLKLAVGEKIYTRAKEIMIFE